MGVPFRLTLYKIQYSHLKNPGPHKMKTTSIMAIVRFPLMKFIIETKLDLPEIFISESLFAKKLKLPGF